MFSKMLSRVKGGKPSTLAASALPPAVHVNYHRAFYRWHMDEADPVAIILLHDVMSCATAWHAFNRSIGQLPMRGRTSAPLQLFIPDLRGHGASPSDPNATLLHHAADVISLMTRVVEPESSIYLIGMGLGGRVALTSALCSGAFPSLAGRVHGVAAIEASLTAAPIPAGIIDVACALQNHNPPFHSLADAEAALATQVPNAEERAHLLLNLIEGRTKDASATWRLDAPGVAKAAPQLYSGATLQELAKHAAVFEGQTTLVRAGGASKQPEATDATMAQLFPSLTTVFIPEASFSARMVKVADSDLVVDRIFDHLKITSELPPPPQEEQQQQA